MPLLTDGAARCLYAEEHMSPVAAFKRTSAPLAQELEDIFLEHSRLVYRTAYSVTGSAQDAEDVVQTLFLQLLRHGLPPGLDERSTTSLPRINTGRRLFGDSKRYQRISPRLSDAGRATRCPPRAVPADLRPPTPAAGDLVLRETAAPRLPAATRG